MLAFTNYALEVIRQGGIPAFTAVLQLGSSTSLTPDLISPLQGRLGTMRASINVATKAPDLSAAFVTCDNGADQYSPDVAGSALYGVDYAGRALSIAAGVTLPTGGVEDITLFQGRLAYVDFSAEGATAEFKAVDVLEHLSNTSVGTAEGTTLEDDCPAALILALLGTSYANVLAYVQTTSFTAPQFQERSERCILRGFTIQRGTWYQNIQQILSHAGDANVRVQSSGLLAYVTYRPQKASPTDLIAPNTCLKSLSWYEDFVPVRNKVKVTRSDGAGDFVDTAFSPLSDASSVAAKGARWDDTQQFDFFTEDFPAEQGAGQRLFFKTKPLRTYEMELQYEGIRFEPGDLVLVKHPRLGTASKTVLVVSRDFNPNTLYVKLTAIDSVLTNQPWIYCDGAKTLNGSGVVW